MNIAPCGPHGSCTDAPSGVLCTCDAEYDGPFCTHRKEARCQDHKGLWHNHGSKWMERCDQCQCHFGHIECETAVRSLTVSPILGVKAVTFA